MPDLAFLAPLVTLSVVVIALAGAMRVFDWLAR